MQSLTEQKFYPILETFARDGYLHKRVKISLILLSYPTHPNVSFRVQQDIKNSQAWPFHAWIKGFFVNNFFK